VLTEVSYLLRRDRCDADELFALAEAGVITIGIAFNRERANLRTLLRKYRSVPMSLADATLVRLSELHRDCRVFTFDTDFRIYRRHGNKVIPLLTPKE
jgi:predicted nucleic acid-binding protein